MSPCIMNWFYLVIWCDATVMIFYPICDGMALRLWIDRPPVAMFVELQGYCICTDHGVFHPYVSWLMFAHDINLP